ncbi:cyclic diguanylate phosphodiesterase [Aliidongia dinghuensis]|uniref:cyclic-guanylate-specific phosphodiesterase n=1 Tax=Aliidongia dinghuensis TaxID=1867774 RepID=A0A8J2YUS4_9PROT|nr:EAL domain-containing protein [Aliidongia dinghuensis]GGF24095.1 cyclic diguanylate phosphodiesterase [Aliidongia dinghuensis]
MLKPSLMRSPEGLIVLLAALLPLVVIAGLCWRTANLELERQLDAAADTAVADADRLIGDIVTGLHEREGLVGTDCTPATIEQLDHLTYESPLVRSAGLFDGKGQLYCTSRGAFRADISTAAGSTRRGGLVMRVGRAIVTNRTSLIVQLRRDDEAGIGAVADLALFDQLATPLSFEGAGAVSVVLGEATPLRTAGRPIESMAKHPFCVSRRSHKFDVAATVTVPRAMVWSLFRRELALFGAAGVMLSAMLAWLALRGIANRQSLTRGLRAALRRRQFEVHYHPVIDIQNDRCVGAEALIRWRHPDRGLIRPDLFIPVAEETGLIIPITRWLMNRVRDDFEGVDLPRDFHIAINLAPVQFKDRTIVDDIRAIFSGRNLSPAMLVLEATERFPIDDAGRKVIDALRTMGPGIALDDFGTGHSGLAYLQKFHGDYLKIDKTFVQTIGTDAVTRTVVDSIINLARELDMEIIAEGVETVTQLKYLRQRGVPYAQGFLFAQPLPFAEFENFRRTHPSPCAHHLKAEEAPREEVPA